MSNEEFLRRLEGALAGRVPQEDVDDAMSYHREYFAEAGEDAAESLPTPEAVAEQIVREREAYLRKRQLKWAKPAIIAASVVGVLVTLLVVSAVKVGIGRLPLWNHAVSGSYATAYIDQVTEAAPGTMDEAQFTTVRDGNRVSVSGNLPSFTRVILQGDAGNVTIATGDAFYLDMEYDQRENLDYSVEDDTLYITGEQKGVLSTGYKKGGHINLTVPDGWALEWVDAELNMGNIVLDGITANDAELDAALGDIRVSGGTFFNTLQCDSDLGNVSVRGVEANVLRCDSDAGNVDCVEFSAQETFLEAELGNITAVAVGSAEDYRLSLEVDLGEVKVDGQKASNHYETSRGSRVLSAQADLGNVTVDFTG